MENGDLQAAIPLFDALGGYSDSKNRANVCRYGLATEALNAGDYTLAAERFQAISRYSDSAEQVRMCLYLEAEKLFNDKQYQEALLYYQKAAGYGESKARISECRYQLAEDAYGKGEYEKALSLLENETGDSALALARRCYFALGEAEAIRGNIPGAVAYYAKAVPDADAQQRLFAIGADFAAMNENKKAIEVLWLCGDYEASAAMLKELSELLAASGKQADAIMCCLVLEDTAKAGELFRSVTKEEWEAALGGYGYVSDMSFITEMRYRYAGMLTEHGKYDEAYAEYLEINWYKDVDRIVTQDDNLAAVATAIAAARDAKIATFRLVGNVVTFGYYEQDNNTGNGKEPIEWIVLEVNGNKALLISRYALDCKPYNTSYTGVFWSECSLRTWLNGTFYETAFSPEERTGIAVTMVDNGKNQMKYVGGENNTQDRVFLLSYGETWSYFSNDSMRYCQPTEYAVAQGVDKASNGNCWWWMRGPGHDHWTAADVGATGVFSFSRVNDDDVAVRPALWLDLTSDIF